MPRQYIDPQTYLDKIAALEAENADLKARLDSAAKAALAETPIIEAGLSAEGEKPSAADLDAVAAEQKAADATSDAGEPTPLEPTTAEVDSALNEVAKSNQEDAKPVDESSAEGEK